MVYKKSRHSRRSRRRSRVSRRKHKRHSRKRRAGNPFLAKMAAKKIWNSKVAKDLKAKAKQEGNIAMMEAKGLMRNKLNRYRQEAHKALDGQVEKAHIKLDRQMDKVDKSLTPSPASGAPIGGRRRRSKRRRKSRNKRKSRHHKRRTKRRRKSKRRHTRRRRAGHCGTCGVKSKSRRRR